MHLRELDLSRLSDGELSAQAMEHLHWCARCRSAAAEFDWLQQEITGMLAAAADAAPGSQPKWWDVQKRLTIGQQQRSSRRRLSAIAGVVLAISLVLSVPSFLGTTAVAQQTASPEPVVAWAPGADVTSVSAVASAEALAPVSMSAATPTPPTSPETITPSPAPVSVPVPTLP